VVVPYEAAGLVGAAQVLVDALGRSEDAVPAAVVTNGSGGPEKNGGITSR